MKPGFGLAMLACLSLTLVATQAAAQNIYKWTDAEGRVHFSDQPPPGVSGAEVVGQASKTERAIPPSASPSSAHGPMPDVDFSPGSPASRARDQLQRERDEQEAARVRAANPPPQQRSEAPSGLTDSQVIARCKSRRDTYCDEGAAEIRRRDLEHEWHQYDVERNRAAAPLPGTPNYRPPSAWRTPPPVPPSEPRPEPAQSLYDKNTKKNRDTKQP
jgi:hypothetical protein